MHVHAYTVHTWTFTVIIIAQRIKHKCKTKSNVKYDYCTLLDISILNKINFKYTTSCYKWLLIFSLVVILTAVENR